MKKIKEFLQRNKIILLIGLLIVLELSIPLFLNGIFIGDDYEYHIARIDSIKIALQEGEFPVKIHSIMANTYGYGSGLFYSNFFIYLPAILEIIGMNIITAYKIFVVIMFIIFFVLSYFSMKEITGDEKSALIGTIIVMLSKGVIVNLYYRFALGEFLGYIFILPAIAGIHNYVYKEFDKPIYIIIGFCGLLFSHLITTLMVIGFCFIYFLINIKSTINNPRKFLKLIVSALIVLALTSAFWMPMAEQYSSQLFRLSKPWTNIYEDSYNLLDFFGRNVKNVGYLVTILVPISIYSVISKKVENKYKIYGILSFSILILLGWKDFWKIECISKIVNLLQFKSRLIGPVTILIAISMAGWCKSISSKINLNYVLIIVVSLSSLFMGMYLKNLIQEKDSRLLSYSQLSIIIYRSSSSIGGGQEYLPFNCDYVYFSSPNVAKYSSLDEIEVKKYGLSCEFEKNKEGKDFIDVPLIYYKGYQAEMIKDDGEKIQLDVAEAEIGLVRVNVPEEKGKIRVYYKKTTIQIMSYILSAVTFIAIIVYEILNKKTKKLQAETEK